MNRKKYCISFPINYGRLGSEDFQGEEEREVNEKTDREKSYSGRGEEGVADGPRAEKGREAGIFPRRD